MKFQYIFPHPNKLFFFWLHSSFQNSWWTRELEKGIYGIFSLSFLGEKIASNSLWFSFEIDHSNGPKEGLFHEKRARRESRESKYLSSSAQSYGNSFLILTALFSKIYLCLETPTHNMLIDIWGIWEKNYWLENLVKKEPLKNDEICEMKKKIQRVMLKKKAPSESPKKIISRDKTNFVSLRPKNILKFFSVFYIQGLIRILSYFSQSLRLIRMGDFSSTKIMNRIFFLSSLKRKYRFFFLSQNYFFFVFFCDFRLN